MKWQEWILAGGGLLFAFSLGMTACGRAGSRSEATPPPPPSIQQERTPEVPQSIQQRWDYLNRLRQSDAYSSINRTLLDDQHHLGAVLAANLSAEQMAAAMTNVMEALARKFPSEDMILDAYAPSTPLRKVGAANFNAQTGKVTFTPAQ
ncbi:MAG TPA: hypothetical protein VGI85_02460 [Chthoniobacterales bacterium]|jgi:hypothetical protein